MGRTWRTKRDKTGEKVMNEYEFTSDNGHGYVYADSYDIDDNHTAHFYKDKREVFKIENVLTVELVP